jgi:hypothetical protein
VGVVVLALVAVVHAPAAASSRPASRARTLGRPDGVAGTPRAGETNHMAHAPFLPTRR